MSREKELRVGPRKLDLGSSQSTRDWLRKKRWMVPEMCSGLHAHACAPAHTHKHTHDYILNNEAGPGFCQRKHEGRVQFAPGFLGLPVTPAMEQGQVIQMSLRHAGTHT